MYRIAKKWMPKGLVRECVVIVHNISSSKIKDKMAFLDTSGYGHLWRRVFSAMALPAPEWKAVYPINKNPPPFLVSSQISPLQALQS